MAKKGGVLIRAGHTEAGCDLARLAGFESAAVIVEILNDDGTMARRGDLEKFTKEHDLKLGTIEDLIRYRIENENSVERIVESRFPTDFGDFMARQDRASGYSPEAPSYLGRSVQRPFLPWIWSRRAWR